MVEADTYLNILDSFERGTRNYYLNTVKNCPVTKVVWSSFDYMNGPELKFTWNTNTSSNSPTNESNSTSEYVNSNGSVVSRENSGTYEDIDDVYNQELLITSVSELEVCPICMHVHIEDGFLCDMCGLDVTNRRYLDEYLDNSQSTLQATSTTLDEDDSYEGDNISGHYSSEKLIESNEQDAQSPFEEKFKSDESPSEDMIRSAVDSGIAGTISIDSEACLTNLGSQCGQTDTTFISSGNEVNYDEIGAVDNFLEDLSDITVKNLTDEEFIAKFVLADQIYSLQTSMNPLIHKFVILPARSKIVASYIFCVKRKSFRRNRLVFALSFIMDLERQNWYMYRQAAIEAIFSDLVPRLKAAYFVEELVDFVCRLTNDIGNLLNILCATEHYPLCRSITDIKLRRTYLSSSKLADNSFLARAITALLQCQGYCVVIGNHPKNVSKMLNTLVIFIHDDYKWLCIQPYKYVYSPYLKLQTVKREELMNVMNQGVICRWPIAIIDMDKQLVCVSAGYPKHRLLRQRKEYSDIARILSRKDLSELIKKDEIKLDVKVCMIDEMVLNFLNRLDILPFDRQLRIGFIQQFLLSIENRAKALISYVQDVSRPNQNDKRSAVTSRWSLRSARKALDLEAESTFSIVLAGAERLLPDITEFICYSRRVI